MPFYLVRHGLAVSKLQNQDRPLSDKGRFTMEKVASFLSRSRFKVSGVLHSEKLRSKETAIILSKVLGAGRVVQESPVPIGPNDPIEPLVEMFQNSLKGRPVEDQVFVSHLPFLDLLLSHLVCGEKDFSIMSFEPGMAVALEPSPKIDRWTIKWALRPSLLGE